MTVDEQNRLSALFPEIVAATCPFVKKIHKLVSTYSSPEVDTIIIGKAGHPEVIGIKSYAAGDVYIFDSPESISCFENVNFGKKDAILVSQTTNNTENYKKCQNVLKFMYTNLKVFDTICSVTESRQSHARKESCVNDIMIVVGG